MTDKVRLLMKNLDISEEEALQLIADDKEIDSMTSQKEIDADLTEEQRKVKKESTITTSQIKTATKRNHVPKPNLEKEFIISELEKCLNTLGTNINVLNKAREISFDYGNDNYKITLTTTRKAKS